MGYDRTCDTCRGRTTVRGVRIDALPGGLRDALIEAIREDAEYRALVAMERRYGA